MVYPHPPVAYYGVEAYPSSPGRGYGLIQARTILADDRFRTFALEVSNGQHLTLRHSMTTASVPASTLRLDVTRENAAALLRLVGAAGAAAPD